MHPLCLFYFSLPYAILRRFSPYLHTTSDCISHTIASANKVTGGRVTVPHLAINLRLHVIAAEALENRTPGNRRKGQIPKMGFLSGRV